MTDCEAIVRTLAATSPIAYHSQGGFLCALCHIEPRRYDPPVEAEHDPDCPWRIANEWVAADEDRHRLTEHVEELRTRQTKRTQQTNPIG